MQTDTYTDAIRDAAKPLGDHGYVITDIFDPGDVWGSLMMSAFMLNDVLLEVGGETSPTFRQGLGPDVEAFGYTDLLTAVEEGRLPVENLETARERLDALIDRANDDGLSY